MTRIITLLCALLSIPLLAANADEPSGKDLTPLQITEKVRKVLPSVKNACVSFFFKMEVPGKGEGDGRASAVIISNDGYLLMAGHVISDPAEAKNCSITLADGRNQTVSITGYNLTADTGLLKIEGEEENWPCVQLAEKVPANGSLCFTYARPGTLDKNHPPQLRIGRIKGRTITPEKTDLLHTDINTQSGDSGGPLFDAEGRLIGIACVSCGPGLTHFTSIEKFHADMDRLKKGEKWGDKKENPALSPPKQVETTDRTVIARIVAAANKQVKDRYRPTLDALRRKQASGSKAALNDLLTNVDMMILMGSELTYGLDDPALIQQLPALPEGSPKPYPILHGRNWLTHGFAVSKKTILVKRSEIKGKEEALKLYLNKKALDLMPIGEDPTWDLTLLKMTGEEKLPPFTWPEKPVPVGAGTPLLSPDIHGRLSWGIACDESRAIASAEKVDPWLDKTPISSHRGPYPPVIRHCLPLFARDAGTPVYAFNGELVGLHMGRVGCAFGIIIPMKDIRASVDKMVGGSTEKTPEKPKKTEY